MPIPLLFIGAIAVTGATGIGSGVKAGFDQHKAKLLNDNSNTRLEVSALRLENARIQCRYALEALGKEKLFVLNGSMQRFLDSFTQLKNVDFRDSLGLEELRKFHIDQQEFEELAAPKTLAGSLAAGAIGGAAGGAITALGAYSAAGALASASTGTAISTLSGIAAHNATLAFFGGGSLAAGGMGMAGGAMVLSGFVAGPALLVLGSVVGAKAGKNLNNAKASAAETDVYCEQYENGTIQCIAIRRRTYMFYTLLARLDASFLRLISDMDEIIKNEGIDYSQFTMESKKKIASAAATAVTIKSILDTPLLNEDGSLTESSEQVIQKLTEG